MSMVRGRGPERLARKVTDRVSDHISQRRIALVALGRSNLVIDKVTFGQLLGCDSQFRHGQVYQ